MSKESRESEESIETDFWGVPKKDPKKIGESLDRLSFYADDMELTMQILNTHGGALRPTDLIALLEAAKAEQQNQKH